MFQTVFSSFFYYVGPLRGVVRGEEFHCTCVMFKIIKRAYMYIEKKNFKENKKDFDVLNKKYNETNHG